jgi:MurNAc alpha-1-phosphate uridylyltransferase
MSVAPRQAMVLAAGLGTRMRPLTEWTAKPLLPLGGRALLDHALQRLAEAGVARVVVNAHWQAGVVRAHLARWRGAPEIVLREEASLLDTGGAVLAALEAGDLADAPFFVVNGDAFWLDGPSAALGRLARRFDPAVADVCLLLHRTFQVHAETGPGDFSLDEWGRPARRGEMQIVPYIYAGVQLATPALYAGAPEGAFSNNLLWDRAIASGRAQAVVHDGLWFHLSTPEDLAEAEMRLCAGETGEST